MTRQKLRYFWILRDSSGAQSFISAAEYKNSVWNVNMKHSIQENIAGFILYIKIKRIVTIQLNCTHILNKHK